MMAPGSGTSADGFAVRPAGTPAPSHLRGDYASPTDRVYDVLAAVVRCGGNVPAAASLGMSVHTVNNHLIHLRTWYHAASTAHLAALVMRDVGDIFGDKASWTVSSGNARKGLRGRVEVAA